MNDDRFTEDNFNESVEKLEFSQTINGYELKMTIFQSIERYECDECEVEVIWPTHVEENNGKLLYHPQLPTVKELKCEEHQFREIHFINENEEKISLENPRKN